MEIVKKYVSGSNLLELRSDREIRLGYLWVIRAIFLVFIVVELAIPAEAGTEPWTISQYAFAGVFMILLYLFLVWLVSVDRTESSDQDKSVKQDTSIEGADLWFLSEGQSITKKRLWAARIFGGLVWIIALGVLASSTPGNALDATAAPILTVISLIAPFGVYFILLHLISRAQTSGEMILE